MKQRLFVLHRGDNVGTALDDLTLGPVEVIGECDLKNVECIEPVKFGHKMALVDLSEGAEIRKHNVVIARAFKAIQKGQMVHLHNIESQFDERASTLDTDTGAPTDEDIYQ